MSAIEVSKLPDMPSAPAFVKRRKRDAEFDRRAAAIIAQRKLDNSGRKRIAAATWQIFLGKLGIICVRELCNQPEMPSEAAVYKKRKLDPEFNSAFVTTFKARRSAAIEGRLFARFPGMRRLRDRSLDAEFAIEATPKVGPTFKQQLAENDMYRQAVLELIDQAPAFAEPQPLSAEDLRKAGLAALDQAIERLKAAEGDARTTVLQEVATEAGSIIGAGAVNEPFAKALLEDAAAAGGLIKAIGAKAVKAAIAAALKVGKKTPRDFSTDMLSQPRPGEAGNSAAVHVLPSLKTLPMLPAAPAHPRPPDSAILPFFVVVRRPRAPGGAKRICKLPNGR
jgi:hypothetical protein